MVVYAHSVIPGHHFSGWAELVDRFVRAVAVPMFMSISGFLYCLANQGSRPYGRLMKEKVHRLVLPYVVLSSLAYVIKASLGHVASRPLEFTWKAYVHQLLYPWDNAIILLWFLPTLFFIFVISIAIDKLLLSKGRIPLPALLVVFLILGTCIGIRQTEYPVRILNLYGVLNYLINFWAGYAICRYERAFTSGLVNSWRALLLLASSIALTVTIPDANYALAVIEGVSAFAALLGIAALVSKKTDLKLLSFIGDNSYQIYLLSWFFQTMPIIALSRFLIKDQYLCASVSLLLGTSGPLLTTYFVRTWMPSIGPLIGFRPPRRA